MAIDMTEVRKLFFEESFESLNNMESSLLDLDVGGFNKEEINSIFRVIHSIKGGAGIFKFDDIIEFTHTLETLLDEMRNEQHVISQSLIDILLNTVDVTRMMLQGVLDDTEVDSETVQQCQAQVLALLKNERENTATNDESTSHVEVEPSTGDTFLVTTVEEALSDNAEQITVTPPATQNWHILFKPFPHLLKTGNEPLNIFRELGRLGTLQVHASVAHLPAFEDLDPQSCYLSWELTLVTSAPQADIEEIFEWVEEDCELQINLLGSDTASVFVNTETTPAVTALTIDVENADAFAVTETTPIEAVAEKALADIEAELSALGLESTTLETIDEEVGETLETSPPILESDEDDTNIAVSTATPPSVITPSVSVDSMEALSEIVINETVTHETKVAEPARAESPVLTTPPSNTTTETAEKELPTQLPGHTESSSIRVNIDKIDDLINIVGELVITQSMLEQLHEDMDNNHFVQLRNGLTQLERHTRELQESVMRIRMLPISYSFNRFPRLVHDLSTQLGKKVALKLSGESTELDKTVLEKISDPLVHLVRNALDHGIELPAVRQEKGKNEIGTLHLHAFHQGGNIVIQIGDDGAGFNFNKIRQHAASKRLINPEDNLNDEQLQEFIFQPGFSTAQQVSNLSGRGVGMDVVRRNIRELGGNIEVQSQQDVGTTFTIRLPLTLAILDGQLVRVGEQIYILSLLSIIESLRVNTNLVNSLARQAEVYKLRDEYIPIIRLYQLFNITPSNTALDQGLLVIVEGDGQKIGLFVDELLAQQQIVIKSLESNYKQVQGIAGATILGDGNVALILDVAGLVRLSQQRQPVLLTQRPSANTGVRL